MDDAERAAWREALARTEIAQPAICLGSMIYLRLLDALGVKPVAVGGHSLGELTAYSAAGAFDERTLFAFAALRGQAMAAKDGEPGAMSSFGCDAEQARSILEGVDGYVVVANLNSPSQTTISGEEAAVAEAERRAAEAGVHARRLPVSNAFHSRLVASAADSVASAQALPSRAGELCAALFSSVDGGRVQPAQDMNAHFAAQILAPVRFLDMARNLARECDLLLEVGPGAS